MTKEEYKLSLGTCHFYCNYDSVTDAQWAVSARVWPPCVSFGVALRARTRVAAQAMFYRVCFLLYVSEVCCPRCTYAMGIKLAWYFFWGGGVGSFEDNDPPASVFNTLHSLFLWCEVFFFPPGGWGGLSWGNCPWNFQWRYRETDR